jgi:hypothetical protein
MRAFGRLGCRSCCASMEEEERPSKRWACGPVNRSSANALSPLLATWPRDGWVRELGRPGSSGKWNTENTLTASASAKVQDRWI